MVAISVGRKHENTTIMLPSAMCSVSYCTPLYTRNAETGRTKTLLPRHQEQGTRPARILRKIILCDFASRLTGVRQQYQQHHTRYHLHQVLRTPVRVCASTSIMSNTSAYPSRRNVSPMIQQPQYQQQYQQQHQRHQPPPPPPQQQQDLNSKADEGIGCRSQAQGTIMTYSQGHGHGSVPYTELCVGAGAATNWLFCC